MKDVLKCVTTNSGVLSVMMDGELLMLMWLADRLDSLDSVSLLIVLIFKLQILNFVVGINIRCSSS